MWCFWAPATSHLRKLLRELLWGLPPQMQGRSGAHDWASLADQSTQLADGRLAGLRGSIEPGQARYPGICCGLRAQGTNGNARIWKRGNWSSFLSRRRGMVISIRIKVGGAWRGLFWASSLNDHYSTRLGLAFASPPTICTVPPGEGRNPSRLHSGADPDQESSRQQLKADWDLNWLGTRQPSDKLTDRLSGQASQETRGRTHTLDASAGSCPSLPTITPTTASFCLWSLIGASVPPP